MAGLIDVGILKPELAGSFAAGYRGAEKARQEAEQARQQSERTQQQIAQGRQQMQMDEFTLQKLREDRAALTDLQAKLRSAGQSDDPKLFFQTLINTGNPDYMNKGYEGLQRYKELQQADQVLRQFAPEMFVNAATPAKPITAMAPGALGSGTFGVMPEPINALAPKVTETPQPTNAMVAAPVADNAPDVNALRRQLFMLSSVNDPRAKAMADVIKGQITEASKPYVVGGRLVTGAGKELYTAPEKAPAPTNLARLQAELAALPPGDARRKDYEALIRKETTHAPGTTVNVSTEKKYGERFGGLIADADAAKLAAAENAPNAAATADRVMDLIATGKVITGTGANARLQLAKALNLAGGTDSEKIRNTEVLISSLAETTLGAIKSSNLGAGQGFTNADRDFLEKAKAGQLTYDSKSLTELARLSRLAAEKSAESWNKRVQQIPASALEGTGISTEPVIVPKRSSPAAARNIPEQAIIDLKAGRGTREQFDEIFGPDAAAKVLKR